MSGSLTPLLCAVAAPLQQLVGCHFETSQRQVRQFQAHGLALPLSLGAACAQRQAAFLAGRWCARQALARLGVHTSEVPIGADRAPCWPAPVLGSISHCAGEAVALVGLRTDFRAIGLDVETIPTTARAHAFARHVMVAEEMPPPAPWHADFALWFTLVFSAKESLFKALYPRSGTPFYFHDAQLLALDPERGTFRMLLTKHLSAAFTRGDCFVGQFACDQQRVLTTLTLPV